MTIRKPAVISRSVIGAAAILAVALACSEGAVEKTVVARVSPAPDAIVKHDQSTAPGRNAKEEFHAKNHMDWVGQAHNRALNEFFVIMKSGPDRKDLCTLMLKYMADEFRFQDGKPSGTAEDRQNAAKVGVSKGRICESRLGSTEKTFGMLASVTRPASAPDEVSPEASAIVTQIESAALTASSSLALAASLDNILAQSSGLIVDEVDAVYAIASIAMSSTEYWEANLVPQTDEVQATYGSCLAQFPDATSALNSCLGLNPPQLVTPTNWIGFADPWSATFASSSLAQQQVCYRYRAESVAADIGGAVLGFLVGLVTKKPMIMAIGGGAIGASISTSYAGMAMYVYCRINGGASDREKLQTT